MSDSHHTKIQTWLAAIGILFLVLAFFGVSRFTDFFGNSQSATENHAAAPALKLSSSPPAEPSAAPAPPAGGESPRIEAKGEHASLSLGPVKPGGTRDLVTTVTVKLHNGGKSPVRIAWLAAENNASFDLGLGRLAVGRAAGPFAGIPNCSYGSADQCRPTGGTALASGETLLVTMTLAIDLPAGDSDRALKAKRGTFTARLSVYPPGPASGVEKTVNAEVPVKR